MQRREKEKNLSFILNFFGNFDDQVRYFVTVKSDFVSNLIKMLKSLFLNLEKENKQ